MPNNQAPAAAAAGGNPAYVLPPTIKIGDFHGDAATDGSFTISTFIEDVNKATAMNGWTDEQTGAYASGFLKGPAATFLMTIKMDPEREDEPKRWSTLHPALKERFDYAPDIGAAADAMKSLKIKDKESYSQFADRCVLNKRRMDQTLDTAFKLGGPYKFMFKRVTVAAFLNGIPEGVRAFLLNHHKDKGLNDVAAAANEFTKNASDKKPSRQVDELESEASVEEIRAAHIEALDNQLAAWNASSKAQPFTFNNPRAKNRGGRGGASNRGGGGGANRGMQPLFQGLSDAAMTQLRNYPNYGPEKVLCFNCWKFGSHYAHQYNGQRRDKPPELSHFEPRRGRNRQRPAGNAGQKQVNEIDANPPQSDNGGVANMIQGLQGQVNNLTGAVAALMSRSSSDTSSQFDDSMGYPPLN